MAEVLFFVRWRKSPRGLKFTAVLLFAHRESTGPWYREDSTLLSHGGAEALQSVQEHKEVVVLPCVEL